MDFPQQIEETLLEHPASSYDVIMESPISTSERKTQPRYTNAKLDNVINTSSSTTAVADKMSSSINSTLEDTTPSDSGIQMLDSESSEIMIESITSQNGFEFDDSKTSAEQEREDLNKHSHVSSAAGKIKQNTKNNSNVFEHYTCHGVDTNSNVTAPAVTSAANVDIMIASNCSTFDAENIVYRRKVRKSAIGSKAPKKRVSFHEDILKNTRTDNIHIEHGFITYKNGRKMKQQVGVPGRYSWCSEGDGSSTAATAAAAAVLCNHQLDDDHSDNTQHRRVVYRNACSDVLDYGNSDAYDTNDYCLQYDNSGIFEYLPQERKGSGEGCGNGREGGDGQVLYKCSCSSSNSSLDSDENDKNSNRQQYGQAKSSSCDCIGNSNANNNIIGDNCYFSEPNIDNLSEERKKSVWNKEKKPKSSCLKKTNRHTNVIQEQDLNRKVKKFNVHNVNQLIDNSSKMLFGSLKSIFTMPLPERGVPEGSEDLQSVIECVPELEQTPEHKIQPYNPVVMSSSPTFKSKPFLSKSLDGSKQQSTAKNFVHNVDEQLRRKNDDQIYAPTRQNSEEPERKMLQMQQEINSFTDEEQNKTIEELNPTPAAMAEMQQFRNKFIINCESTVFEHTGVSYCYESNIFNGLNAENEAKDDIANLIEKNTPVTKPQPDQLHGAFIPMPIKQTFTNFFRSFKESTTSPTSAMPTNIVVSINNNTKGKNNDQREKSELKATAATDNFFALKMQKMAESSSESSNIHNQKNIPTTTSSSTISDLTSTTSSSIPPKQQQIAATYDSSYNALQLEKQSRHLPSPLKRRQQGGSGATSLLQTSTMPARYEHHNSGASNRMSPDLFNGYTGSRGGSGRDSKSTILSEEFDDILTITTDTDKNESDIVIVDFPELTDRNSVADYANLLKPPQTKTSLINRFLRNVTQKKILETSIRKNNFFANKLKNEQKLFSANLYVAGVKPKNFELIDDLNAEIAMEIEMSGANSPRRELTNIESNLTGDVSRFELGIGEISIDIFNGNYLHILRDTTEQLMKVFKLYTGYSKEGFMTPVLVFLTDKTLYVTDLVRNRLCSKFILAYADLDVILMGPYGNTVLLSNSSRDMQQVLLAGGPYPADALVANLELCARRSGSTLPAVGQLTLQHLAPLQAFVRENTCVTKDETWIYYAVVNVPCGSIGNDQEPLGPHVKGFLMHRRIRENASSSKQMWSAGYFLLKAGVLYMFNDSTQRLPSWAMALAECQGARRAVKAGRPHCFEILLKGQLLQLAAPDEYVASEWLQALLQSASGLFEMQEKHKTLGCTLIVTQNHLITLREDFSTPLRKLNDVAIGNTKQEAETLMELHDIKLNEDNNSLVSSTMSSPTKGIQRSCSSVNSTPTKLSQLSRSTATGNITAPISIASSTYSKQTQAQNNEFYSNMSSVYGKNSGLEILTSADIKEMTGIKIPSHNDTWWCILEFSCQEMRECPDDLVIFFASSSEMQRFLRLLEQLWQAKNNDLFPISVLDEDDVIAEQCTMLYMDINRSWEPLLSAALGYPL